MEQMQMRKKMIFRAKQNIVYIKEIAGTWILFLETLATPNSHNTSSQFSWHPPIWKG